MARKKALRRQATSDALQGNQNAVKPEEERVKPRSVISLSLTDRRREMIRAAIEWYEGYVPDDDVVEEKARQLAYEAWEIFGKSIQREQEGAIIL